jgi:hypothetical protein
LQDGQQISLLAAEAGECRFNHFQLAGVGCRIFRHQTCPWLKKETGKDSVPTIRHRSLPVNVALARDYHETIRNRMACR